jgi:hypothetical protein
LDPKIPPKNVKQEQPRNPKASGKIWRPSGVAGTVAAGAAGVNSSSSSGSSRRFLEAVFKLGTSWNMSPPRRPEGLKIDDSCTFSKIRGNRNR